MGEKEHRSFKQTFLSVLLSIFRVITIISSIALALFLRLFDGFEDDYFDLKGSIVSQFKDPTFWLLTTSLNVLWIIVYYTVYSSTKEKLLKQPYWLEIADRYRKLCGMKIRNFVDFIRLINLRRKKEAYIRRWNRKLVRVQIRIERNSNLLSWRLTRWYGRWRINHLKEKEKRRKERLNDSFINENINYLYARYNRVSINDFTFNKYTEAKITDKTTSNEDKRLAEIAVRKLVLGFIINGFVVSGLTILMGGYIKWKTSSFWISLLAIFISCVMQFVFGQRAAVRLVDSEIIAPTLVKIDIIEESLRWDQADKSNIEFAKALDEQLNPKKAKITKEELKYLEENRDKINQEISKSQDRDTSENNNEEVHSQ